MNVTAEVERRWGVPVRVFSSQDENAGSSGFGERLTALEELVGLATSEKIEQAQTEIGQTRTAVAKLHADIVSVHKNLKHIRKNLKHIRWMLSLVAAGTLIILAVLFTVL